MTHLDQPPAADSQADPHTDPHTELRAELRWIDDQLRMLHGRRAWLLSQLPAPYGPSGPAGPPGPPGSAAATGATGASVQQLLLSTGAVLLGLAGLFFAAVAWTLVGPLGRLAILIVLGAGLAALATWTRPRLRAAAEAIAAVAASLLATAGYAAPALWGVSWSGTQLATYTALISAVLCLAYAAGAVITGIRSWTVAAGVAASLGVVAAGVAGASALDDPLGYTAVTAVLAVAVAAAGRLVRVRLIWECVLAVAAGSSLLSLGAWVGDPDRAVAYAAAMLGWAVLAVVVARLALPGIPPVAAWILGATLAAAAVSLLVGVQPWGAPSLPLAAGAGALGVAVAYRRRLPAWPLGAAAVVLGLGAVMVPVIDGASIERDAWVGYLCLLAAATAAAGWSPRRAMPAPLRAVLWWSGGLAAASAWLVHLSGVVAVPTVEQGMVPVGALLLLAGLGWAVSVRRCDGPWLPSTTTLLPGLLAALVPGALSSWPLQWDQGMSPEMLRTLCYTVVGAVLLVLGARLRLAALLVAGEVTVAICVVAHLSAATQVVPQWAVLAAAGSLLLVVGARWEWLRHRGAAATRWVGQLR